MAQRTLARAQKKAETEGRTIIWVDEAGFYLLPARVRTYAPRGQTPTLRVPLTRDHRSAIRALTADGRVVMHVQTEAFRGPRVVRLLRHRLRQIAGKLLVIGTGRRFIAPRRAPSGGKPFWQKAERSGCGWSNCRGTHPTCIRSKESGTT